MHEWRKFFVEHALHNARILLQPYGPNFLALGTVVSVMNINQRMLAHKLSFTRENKIDQCRGSGCGYFKRLTLCRQSLHFSSSIKKKTKGGCVCRVLSEEI